MREVLAAVRTEIKNRGVEDVHMVVRDGSHGPPDSVNTVWADTIVETCIVYLMHNSLKCSAGQDCDASVRALKPLYQAAAAAAAEEGSASSPRRGTRSVPRSAGSGKMRGPSSRLFLESSVRSAGSSARPMRSSPSTRRFARA